MIPLPLPVSVHRFFTVVGRAYLLNVFSCSWAWYRTCGGSVWFRATYKYARRVISLALTICRALISRRTRALFMAGKAMWYLDRWAADCEDTQRSAAVAELVSACEFKQNLPGVAVCSPHLTTAVQAKPSIFSLEGTVMGSLR